MGIISSPAYILKAIASYNWSLLVSLSIVSGGLLGTIYTSFSIGILVGVASLAGLLAIRRYLPLSYLRAFFYYKKGLPGYATFDMW